MVNFQGYSNGPELRCSLRHDNIPPSRFNTTALLLALRLYRTAFGSHAQEILIRGEIRGSCGFRIAISAEIVILWKFLRLETRLRSYDLETLVHL